MDDELDEAQTEEANEIYKMLEDDMNKFANYKIPTAFFGL
jgi:hypothetical protein